MEQEQFPVESLHQRLAAGLGVKGGSRGSLTRTVGRLGQLIKQQQQQKHPQQSEGDVAKDFTVTTELLQREIQMMHVELTKLALMAQRQRDELTALPLPSPDDVSDARARVQALRFTHAQARATVACQREYESLAKVAAHRYPTPRVVLQDRMSHTVAQIQSATAEVANLDTQRSIREKQFAALMQCLLDFKESLVEPLDVMQEDLPARVTDGGGAGSTETDDGDITTNAPMQVDSPDGKQGPGQDENDDDEEEDGALYEDL